MKVDKPKKTALLENVLFNRPKLLFVVIFVLVALNLSLQWLFASVWFPYYTPSVLAFSVLAMCLPWEANFLYTAFMSLRLLTHDIFGVPEHVAQRWFDKQLDSVFRSKKLYLAAVFLALGGVATTELVRIPWSGFIKFLYVLFTIVLFGMMGAVGWVYLGSLKFLYRLSRLKIKTSPFSYHQKDSIKRLYAIFMQMFLIGVFIYINAVIGVWLSPGGEWLTLHYPLIQIWIFPVAGIVALYFLFVQYFVHKIMSALKSEQVSQISELISLYFNEWQNNPSPETTETINNLLKWKDVIEEQPEWPLNFKSVLSITVGLFLPTIRTIIDLILR